MKDSTVSIILVSMGLGLGVSVAGPAVAGGTSMLPMGSTLPMPGDGADEEMGRRFGRFMGSFMNQVDGNRKSPESGPVAVDPPAVAEAPAAHVPGMAAPPLPTYDPWGATPWGGGRGGYAPHRYGGVPWWEDTSGPLADVGGAQRRWEAYPSDPGYPGYPGYYPGYYPGARYGDHGRSYRYPGTDYGYGRGYSGYGPGYGYSPDYGYGGPYGRDWRYRDGENEEWRRWSDRGSRHRRGGPLEWGFAPWEWWDSTPWW
jgi:hypothetical protein